METDNQQLEWRSQWGFNATNHDSMDWLKERQFQQKSFVLLNMEVCKDLHLKITLFPYSFTWSSLKQGSADGD